MRTFVLLFRPHRPVALSLALALALFASPAPAAGEAPRAKDDLDPIQLAAAAMSGSRPEVDRTISKLKHLGATKERLAPLARLMAEGPPKARQNCAYIFSVIPEPAFADNLERALTDNDEVVRSFAATALGKIKDRGSVKPLVKALGDVSPVVRRESAKALGTIGDRTTAKKLLGLLADANTDVRIAAILALGQLGDKAAEKPLLPLLKDSSETMRLAATKALCAVGSVEGRKPVEAMLASKEPSVRKDGIRLLEGLKLAWAREALLAQTRDKDVGVAITAAKGLALAGDGRGVEWLVYSLARVDLEESVKIEGILEDLQLTAADRKKILAKKPSSELVLPTVEAEKAPPTKWIASALLLACVLAAEPAPPVADAGVAPTPAEVPARPAEPTAEQIDAILSSLSSITDFRARVVAASERFVGVPYQFDPLGEGTGTPPDEDPRLRFDQMDCQTFLETVLALARVRTAQELAPRLDDVRYLGSPAYAHRNHFFEGQWVPANTKKGYVRDATFAIAGRDAIAHVKVITRDRWDRRTVGEKISLPEDRLPIGRFPLSYLPLGKLVAHASDVPSGTVFAVVRADKPLTPTMVSHLGFVVQKDDGTVLRHAGKEFFNGVADEPVAHFVERNASYQKWPVLGLWLLEPVSPSAAP